MHENTNPKEPVMLNSKQTIELLAAMLADKAVIHNTERTDRENAAACYTEAVQAFTAGPRFPGAMNRAKVNAERGLQWLFGWEAEHVIADRVAALAETQRVLGGV